MSDRQTGERRGFPVPPPVLALAALAVQRATSRGGAGRAGRAAAVALGAASAGLAGSASAAFHRHRTTVNPLVVDQSTALVTEGAHGLSRNPMYLGLAGVLTAHALWRGSWTALVPVAAFVAVIDGFQIPPEEAAMIDLFGADYERYRAEVPRWLPVPGLQ